MKGTRQGVFFLCVEVSFSPVQNENFPLEARFGHPIHTIYRMSYLTNELQ